MAALDRLTLDETCRRVVALACLDVLVNTAGIIRRPPALEPTDADRGATLAVNLSAAFLLSQALARRLVALGRGDKIGAS